MIISQLGPVKPSMMHGHLHCRCPKSTCTGATSQQFERVAQPFGGNAWQKHEWWKASGDSSKHDGVARVPIIHTSLLFQCPSTRPPASRLSGALCTRCISTPSNPKTHLCFGSSASHQPSGPQMSALSTPWGCVHPGSLPFSSCMAMTPLVSVFVAQCLCCMCQIDVSGTILAWLSDLPPPSNGVDRWH